MSLTNTAIKAARPQPRPYKLFDEKGLFLSVEPTGGRLWRFKYRYNGKEKKLALGAYPDVGLKEAREKRDEARALLAAGIDPGQKRKSDRQAQVLQAANKRHVPRRSPNPFLHARNRRSTFVPVDLT
ncbi:MAG: hypothetical protein BGN85_10345 [Alphaproteobacteria bacterium 64-11]|nr:DUF4102 domain-containing protein [Alphaproteobacteria bacterium]OJU11039.1 MAG: hypothetical protein BGN85_10345 [Alphaproteobacteria bacterium 64-11]